MMRSFFIMLSLRRLLEPDNSATAMSLVSDQSKGKMRFQSFFMLITIQPFFMASS